MLDYPHPVLPGKGLRPHLELLLRFKCRLRKRRYTGTHCYSVLSFEMLLANRKHHEPLKGHGLGAFEHATNPTVL